jgi:ABC-type lipoprotein export system ATPase subunit
MIKGPLKISIVGPQGSGKTSLLNLIEMMLTLFGYNIIVSDEAHTLEILKKD